MSHDRTGKPVVCRDIGHEQGQEIQRQNSEREQIRTPLDRQEKLKRQSELSERFRDFCDLETASSSGLSHVPSHLVTVLNLCGMLAACLGNERSVTDTHCELVSLNTGRVAATEEEVERNIFESGQCLHRDLPASF